MSFYVKGNASAVYTLELVDSDNARQISKTFAVTSSWNRITLTYPADTTGAFNNDNGTALSLFIYLHAGSTFTSGTLNSAAWGAVSNSSTRISSGGTSFFDSTNRTFSITGFQLEVGSTATPFEHRSYGEELMACQRYFQKSKSGTPTQNSFGGHQISVASGRDPQSVVYLNPTMRDTPTLTLYSAHGSGTSGQWYGAAFGGGFSSNARAFGSSSRQFIIDNTDVGASTNGWAEIGWTAESEL